MPPYDLINQQYVALMLALGLGVSVLVALGRSSTHFTFSLRRRSEQPLAGEPHEFGGGVSERNGPVPLLVWLCLAAVLVWAAGYTLFSGAFGL